MKRVLSIKVYLAPGKITQFLCMVGLDLGDSLPTKTHQAFVIEADGNFRTRRMGNAFLDAVIFQPYLEMLCPFSDKIATGLGIIPFSQMQVCSQISATE